MHIHKSHAERFTEQYIDVMEGGHLREHKGAVLDPPPHLGLDSRGATGRLPPCRHCHPQIGIRGLSLPVRHVPENLRVFDQRGHLVLEEAPTAGGVGPMDDTSVGQRRREEKCVREGVRVPGKSTMSIPAAM